MTLTQEEWVAIWLSVRVATVATLFALPVAIGCALLLTRAQFRGKLLLDATLHLPLVLPPVVTGYMLLLSFGKTGPIGAFLHDTFGFSFAFNWTGAALASGIMGFPLMLRAIRLSFETVDRRLEAAASTLGASPAWTFALVTLPLALPGIIAGALLCFAKALGEFGATITFVSNIPGETQTIASAIYSSLEVPGAEAVTMRLTIVAIAIAFVAVIASELIARRALRRVSVFSP